MNDFVNLKLGKMRKPQEFSVQDINNSEYFIIQSDKAIGRFHKLTGNGIINFNGCYFPHLSFAKPYALTIAELDMCLGEINKKGDILGSLGGSSIIYGGITEI